MQEVIDVLIKHPAVGPQISEPSLSAQGTGTLYMHGPLEETYRGNLSKPLAELIGCTIEPDSCVMLLVTDKKLQDPLKVRLVFDSMNVDS